MDPAADWAAYAQWPPLALVERLAEVTQALSQLFVEHGMVRGQEKQAKVRGFASGAGETVTARQHLADANAVLLTEEVFSLEAQIKSLQEEQGLLVLLLNRADTH